MSHEPANAGGAGPTKLVIRNIGMLLSGRLEEPILDADCLIAKDGKILGYAAEAKLHKFN